MPKKDLILTGHFYFDLILNKVNTNQIADEILIAPTWSYNYKEYINKNFIEIINELVKKNHKVTFRPHPEHYKRSRRILEIIKDRFSAYNNFRFDNHFENIKSMERAKCLITDISDIALEYMLLLNRPVLYLNFDKIHNEKLADFKDFETIEHKFKNEFGLIFFEEDIKKIDLLVQDSIKNFSLKIPKLNQLKNKYYFNFGKTIEEFEKTWEDKILES